MIILALLFVGMFFAAPYPADVWIAAGGVLTCSLALLAHVTRDREDR